MYLPELKGCFGYIDAVTTLKIKRVELEIGSRFSTIIGFDILYLFWVRNFRTTSTQVEC